MQDFHVVLMSNADISRYPNNKATHFTNTLATPVEMKGNWSVGLESIVCTGKVRKSPSMFVCCNLVDDSFVGNKQMPLLRVVQYDSNINLTFDRVNYKQVGRSFLNSIEVEIRDEENNIYPPEEDMKVLLVLHFKPMQ